MSSDDGSADTDTLGELLADDDADATDSDGDGRGAARAGHTIDVDLDTDQAGIYDLERHRNGDETAVVLTALGDGYQVLAIDTDSAGQVLAVEEVGDADEGARAASIAEYWTQQHPEGILGAEDAGGGGGLLGKLRGLFGGGGA